VLFTDINPLVGSEPLQVRLVVGSLESFGSDFSVITGYADLGAVGDGMGLDQIKRDQLVKKTRWLVWGESLVILGLLVWVSLEYENNFFLQSWARTNIGPVSFLLNGTLAGLYAGTLLGYVVAEYAGRKTEEEKILESLRKKTLS
jgi:hypothetical protein